MVPARDGPPGAVTDHGGSLSRAAALFPEAVQPWIDLSTGISPFPYPLPVLPATAFHRLPEESAVRELNEVAAVAYGAPSGDHVVAAPGTQILLPLVSALVPAGRAIVLGPTYAEHARAAALVGHAVEETSDFSRLFEADLAIVVNPNNPDGRVCRRADLLRLAAHLRAKGGLLVVDEAFMDVGPQDERLDGDVAAGGLVVLRSFGKFFGHAGLRLGFALADGPAAKHLRDRLGPWAVAGPALAVGLEALTDLPWQASMRERLSSEAERLDRLLAGHGLLVEGGTSLFRFLRSPRSEGVFRALGRHGILVRHFERDPFVLRFGLPQDDQAFRRLAEALGTIDPASRYPFPPDEDRRGANLRPHSSDPHALSLSPSANASALPSSLVD